MSSVIKLQNVPPLDAWSKDAQWYKTVGSWRRVHSGSQGDEWGALGAAARVDGIAALESASYGVGQLMGWHYAMLGYASPKEMVSYAMQGVVRQIEQWGIYLRKEEGGKLLSAMKAKDWYSFAYIYNGPGQPEKYAKNIAKQYDVAVEALAEGVPPDFDLTTWRGRQEALAALGYDPGPIDGIPGSKTKSAIKAFQADRQLNPDGIWGPRTEKAMQEELAKP